MRVGKTAREETGETAWSIIVETGAHFRGSPCLLMCVTACCCLSLFSKDTHSPENLKDPGSSRRVVHRIFLCVTVFLFGIIRNKGFNILDPLISFWLLNDSIYKSFSIFAEYI